ncbi:uncharacterized protein M6B38_354155 [Iris pallida]|uniref:Uncharacterized protein n=1 Tax=Iris pallida TaxID=29817 RepID=A0AAX6GP91_IRIPA|nr:uncharacterized protein M6B38_354155 [Iris pallida]
MPPAPELFVHRIAAATRCHDRTLGEYHRGCLRLAGSSSRRASSQRNRRFPATSACLDLDSGIHQAASVSAFAASGAQVLPAPPHRLPEAAEGRLLLWRVQPPPCRAQHRASSPPSTPSRVLDADRRARPVQTQQLFLAVDCSRRRSLRRKPSEPISLSLL